MGNLYEFPVQLTVVTWLTLVWTL